jgi:hypothetical protein
VAEVPPQYKPARMTGWFNPKVLAQSAVKLFTANIFGRHSDTRLIEALGSQPQESFDYAQHEGDFWLDYVADLGDGWNPTYAIAEAISRPVLFDTQAGQVLVFGGDQVYPYPTREAYSRRTEWPYQTAFAARSDRPDIFSVPGNHDWFDSLLELPQDWWLVGIDLQLGADFDEPQVRYFRQIAAQMGGRAKVILCVPEPQWIYECTYPRYENYSARTLAWFEREVLKRPVRVHITGDLHFYRRAENAQGAQKIISGGGGAFLHPSDKPRVIKLREGFEDAVSYPDGPTSTRLAWRNLLFPIINPQAGWLTAVIYALSAWFASARLDLADIDTFPEAFRSTLAVALREPTLGLWVISVIAGLVFFTDTHSKLYRVLGGVTHAVAHLFAALALAWIANGFAVDVLGLAYASTTQLLLTGALTFMAGAPVGGFIIGLYLLVSVQVFGRHANEAFSSLRIQDYKQFLRLRIGRDGVLTLWCFGIDRVPRRWREEGSGRKVGDDPHATPVREIDRISVR